MKTYRVTNHAKFRAFRDLVHMILWIVATVMFVSFMNAHIGRKPETVEYHTYDIVYETSAENSRIKEPVAREVVYKTIYR